MKSCAGLAGGECDEMEAGFEEDLFLFAPRPLPVPHRLDSLRPLSLMASPRTGSCQEIVLVLLIPNLSC